MMTHLQHDLTALEARRTHLKGQVLETASKIARVISRDIGKFAERETRWRWLRHVDFADGMDDAAISALKAELKAFAHEFSEKAEARLGDESLWLDSDPLPKGANNKSLEANAAVWGALQEIASGFADLLLHHGFPSDPGEEDEDDADVKRYTVVYRPPLYFLDGVYCPSLIESYWSQLGEMRQIGDTIEEAHLETRRKVLEDRWSRF